MGDELDCVCEWLDGTTLDKITVPFSVKRTWYGVDIVAHYGTDTTRMRCLETAHGVTFVWGLNRSVHRGSDWTVGDAMDWLAHRFGCVLVRPEEPNLFDGSGDIIW